MTSKLRRLSREERAARIAGRNDRIARRAVSFMLAALVLAGLVVGAPYAWRAATERHGPDAAKAELELARQTLIAGDFFGAEDAAARAAEMDPKSAAVRVEHARYALRVGAWKLAQAELDVAASLGFKDIQLRVMRAHAWYVRGNPQAAMRELSGGPIPPADRPLALRVEALSLSAMGDPLAEAVFGALTREAANDPEAWIALSRHRDAGGDRGGAVVAIDRALALAPTHVEAVTLRAILTRDQYGLSAALPWFEKAIALDGRQLLPRIEQTMTLADLGEAKQASEALMRARKMRPNHPRLHLLETVLDARSGDYTAARLAYFRADPATRTRANGLLLGGAIAANQGQPREAARLLTMLQGQQPLNLTTRALLGRVWLEAGDGQMAFKAITPMTERADADPYALLIAAQALEMMGQNAAALPYLDRAVRLQRGGATPFILAADVNGSAAARSPVASLRMLLNAGQSEQAVAQSRAIAEANPGVAAAHQSYGDVLMATGDAAGAAIAYQRAANLSFGEGTMLRLTDALLRAGKPVEASKVVALYLEQQPRSVAANALAGAAFLRAQDWAKAIATLEAARASGAGSDVRVLVDLAYAYLGAGQGRLALPVARRAYALMPMNAETSNAYGLALLATGEKGRAPVDLIEKSVVMAPDVQRYRLHLGAAYAARGKRAEARQMLEPLSKSPEQLVAESAKQELAAL
jgi:cellulose synthase operon protein C